MTPREHIHKLKLALDAARKHLMLAPNPAVITAVEIAGHLVALYEEQVRRWERQDRLDRLFPDAIRAVNAGEIESPEQALAWLQLHYPEFFSWPQ